MRRVIGRLAIACILGAAPAGVLGDGLPPGFVRLAEVVPEIRQEMRYAGTDNFLGRPVEGYEAAECWLLSQAAEGLARAAKSASAIGWRLVVFDCYRPERAVADFVAWSKDPGDQRSKSEFYPGIEKSDLFRAGFIATRSQHSKGTTVDIGAEAIDAAGRVVPLDFGTPFDLFAPSSATASHAVPPAAQQNRRRLVELMSADGFENYRKEWWHFTYAMDPAPPSLDTPITPD